jgi:hypothetical protein
MHGLVIPFEERYLKQFPHRSVLKVPACFSIPTRAKTLGRKVEIGLEFGALAR